YLCFSTPTVTSEMYTLSLHDALPIFKGEYNVEFVANGVHRGIAMKQDLLAPEKNVYFSVEILWPELIFMTIALNDFIELHYEFRSEEHTSELQSRENIVCRLLLEKKK